MSLKQSVRDIIRNFHNTNSEADSKYVPALNRRASRIKSYYENFPFVVVWDNDSYQKYVSESGAALEWCGANCVGKYTTHIHRVIKDEWDEWVFNELGGSDLCFWAFTDGQDALMFSLRWK